MKQFAQWPEGEYCPECWLLLMRRRMDGKLHCIRCGWEEGKRGGADNVIVDTDALGLHPVPERFIEATLVLTYPTPEETAVRALGVKTW